MEAPCAAEAADDIAHDACVCTWGTNDHGALCIPTLSDSLSPTRVLALRSQYVRAIATTTNQSFCATGSGTVLLWGAAAGGLPVPVHGAPEDVAHLYTDARHIYALNDEGHVYSWEIEESNTPAARGLSISRLAIPIDVEQLACGELHALALVEGGAVYSWGLNRDGQLGHGVCAQSEGHESDRTVVPRRVEALDELHATVSRVACGSHFSAMLSTSGKLIACGLLHMATLGEPAAGDRDSRLCGIPPPKAPDHARVHKPQIVYGPWEQSELAEIACGQHHTLALARNGQLFSFGESTTGALGHAAAVSAGRPFRVGGALASRPVDMVWATASASVARVVESSAAEQAAIATESRYFFWGTAGRAIGMVSAPTELSEFKGVDVLSVVGRGNHLLALTSGGDVFAWGDMEGGALGLQQLGSIPSPQRLASLDSRRICSLACGGGPHTLALEEPSGRILAWGRNTKGELGFGEADGGGGGPRYLLSGALSTRTAPLLHIAAGPSYSLACGDEARDLLGWGEGARAILGSPNGIVWEPRALDVMAPAVGTAGQRPRLCVQLVAGVQHAGVLTCAASEPRALNNPLGPGHMPLLWGCGDHGALGTGGVTDSPSAVAPGGSLTSTRARRLGLGRSFSAALDVSGALHVWGRQWGARNATTTLVPRISPLNFVGLSGVEIRELACDGRKCILATGGMQPASFEYVPGGEPRQLSRHDGDLVTSFGIGSEEVLALTHGGRCLRLALGAQAFIEAQEIALPPGARAVLLASSRAHNVLYVRNFAQGVHGPRLNNKSHGIMEATSTNPMSNITSTAESDAMFSGMGATRRGTPSTGDRPIWLE